MFATSNLVISSFQKKTGDLSGFKCYGSTQIATPIRLTSTGDIECFSLNGRDCAWGLNNDASCRKYVAQNKFILNPLKCKAAQYKQSNHWCHQGRIYFYEKWQCPSETGLKVAVRLNQHTFRVECLSRNGRTCAKGKRAARMCQKANKCADCKSKIKPKTCMKRDYTSPRSNWCKRGFAYFRYTGEFLCKNRTGVCTALRLSRKGNVECLSKNGKKCLNKLTKTSKCASTALQYITGNKKKLTTVTCRVRGRRSPFQNNKHWCSKGFNALFYRMRRRGSAKRSRKVFRNIRRKILLKSQGWFKKLMRLLRSPKARTKSGIRRIRLFRATFQE